MADDNFDNALNKMVADLYFKWSSKFINTNDDIKLFRLGWNSLKLIESASWFDKSKSIPSWKEVEPIIQNKYLDLMSKERDKLSQQNYSQEDITYQSRINASIALEKKITLIMHNVIKHNFDSLYDFLQE